MIPLKHLAQISFHFTCPNKITRKEFWFAFLYPVLIGFFIAMFPFLIWETAFFLVVINVLPQKIMIVVDFMVKLLAFFAFAVPVFYTFAIASIKRLHDLGHSGYWFVINLIPIFTLYIMHYLGYDILFILTKVIPIVMFLFVLYVGFKKTKHGIEGCMDAI